MVKTAKEIREGIQPLLDGIPGTECEKNAVLFTFVLDELIRLIKAKEKAERKSLFILTGLNEDINEIFDTTTSILENANRECNGGLDCERSKEIPGGPVMFKLQEARTIYDAGAEKNSVQLLEELPRSIIQSILRCKSKK